jgi:molecular chaperone DnaK
MQAAQTERKRAEHSVVGYLTGAMSFAVAATPAVAETKTAIEGGDAEAMKEKATALAQVAMKLGEAIYKEEQAAGASAEAASEEAPTDDNVVDAEFSEVEDDKKD